MSEKCDVCNGSGGAQIKLSGVKLSVQCPKCEGTGKKEASKDE